MPTQEKTWCQQLSAFQHLQGSLYKAGEACLGHCSETKGEIAEKKNNPSCPNMWSSGIGTIISCQLAGTSQRKEKHQLQFDQSLFFLQFLRLWVWPPEAKSLFRLPLTDLILKVSQELLEFFSNLLSHPARPLPYTQQVTPWSSFLSLIIET